MPRLDYYDFSADELSARIPILCTVYIFIVQQKSKTILFLNFYFKLKFANFKLRNAIIKSVQSLGSVHSSSSDLNEFGWYTSAERDRPQWISIYKLIIQKCLD